MKVSARSAVASFGAIVALLVSASFANAQDGKLSFSGYADLKYNNYSPDKDSPNVGTANAESGFMVSEGALFVGYAKEKWSLFLDAPFRREMNGDDAGTGGTANASNNANIVFGADKAQAYVKYKIMDGLHFQLGQFDTMFGVELNDSKDRIFGKTGLVYDAMLPVTHTGVLLGWEGMGINVKLMAANANGKGSQGSDGVGNDKTEYGASVGWANEMWRAQLAYLTRSTNKAGTTPAEHDSRTLMDLTAGVTLPFGLMVDLEYAMLKDPSKNVLTTAANDSEDDGTGLLALVSYKINDDFTAGVRYEMLDKAPSAGTWDKATDYGVALHYNLDANFQARAEYLMYNYDPIATGAKDYDESRFAVGVLASF